MVTWVFADSTKTTSNKLSTSTDSSFRNESLKDLKSNQPQITIQNNIPESKNDYFSAIIPIITLILGFGLNKWYENRTSKRKLKKAGAEWCEHFIQLKEPLISQTERLSEYIPLNDENHFEIQDPFFSIRLDCQEFSTLDDKALIHFLNSGANKLDYRNSVIVAGQLKDIVKLIEHNTKVYKDQIKIMQTEVSTHITSISPLLNDFKILVSRYWDHVNSEYAESDPIMVEAKKMYDLMRTHILPHLDNGEFDLFKMADEFVKPFFNTTFVDRENPSVIEFSMKLNSIDMHIKAIRMEKKYFRIILEKILKSYQEQLKSVSEMILKPAIAKQI